MICIHVGAHHAEEQYPGYTTVYWLEADPMQWDRLAHLNLGRFAAMDYDGEVTLLRRNVSMASSVLPLDTAEKDFTGQPLAIVAQILVPCKKLDTAFSHLRQVDLLVIDVEGAELHVLRGAVELLKRTSEVKIEVLGRSGYPTQEDYALLLVDFMLLEICPGHDGYWADLRYRRRVCQS